MQASNSCRRIAFWTFFLDRQIPQLAGTNRTYGTCIEFTRKRSNNRLGAFGLKSTGLLPSPPSRRLYSNEPVQHEPRSSVFNLIPAGQKARAAHSFHEPLSSNTNVG